jgi:uncharacterized protein YcfJ
MTTSTGANLYTGVLMRPIPSAIAHCACLSTLIAAAVAHAEDKSGQQASNVRTEYAQVLRVQPVFQTLRAYAIEQRCEPPSEVGAAARLCRPTRVPKEFQRPVAYDVDYIHRGVTYRSRLPIDPGKRLRVRITVTPDIPPGERR